MSRAVKLRVSYVQDAAYLCRLAEAVEKDKFMNKEEKRKTIQALSQSIRTLHEVEDRRRNLMVEDETMEGPQSPPAVQVEPKPCLDPDKMNGAGDQFPGSDYPEAQPLRVRDAEHEPDEPLL